MEIKSWLKNFLVDKVKNVYYHSGHKDSKIDCISRMNGWSKHVDTNVDKNEWMK